MGVDMATCGRDKGRPHLPQGVAIASGHPGRGGLRGIKDFFYGDDFNRATKFIQLSITRIVISNIYNIKDLIQL